MSKLYVANLSKNILEFTYRVAGENRYFTTKILPFTQESVYPGGTSDEHAAIVDQNKIYGLVAVSDIDRTKKFIGMCYQFEKPIASDSMIPVAKHNNDVLNQDAQEMRKIGAAAIDKSLFENAAQAGIKLNGLEIGLEEQDSDTDSSISETIAVETRGRRGRRRKA